MANHVIFQPPVMQMETSVVHSEYLERDVTINIYMPSKIHYLDQVSLLLINDGQDLIKMSFEEIFTELLESGSIEPIVCVGIHCGPERKMEYGTAYSADFNGRGAKAGLYSKFIFDELLPLLEKNTTPHLLRISHLQDFHLGH